MYEVLLSMAIALVEFFNSACGADGTWYLMSCCGWHYLTQTDFASDSLFSLRDIKSGRNHSCCVLRRYSLLMLIPYNDGSPKFAFNDSTYLMQHGRKTI